MDEADRAQIYEEQTRERGVHQATLPPSEAPLYIHGIRVCLDCEEEIDQKRIEAVNAVRCQYCQSDHEKRSNR